VGGFLLIESLFLAKESFEREFHFELNQLLGFSAVLPKPYYYLNLALNFGGPTLRQLTLFLAFPSNFPMIQLTN
jgi:hypothetical protein